MIVCDQLSCLTCIIMHAASWYLVPCTQEPLIAVTMAIAGKNVQAQPSFMGFSASNQTRHVSRKERNITYSTLLSYPRRRLFRELHPKLAVAKPSQDLGIFPCARARVFLIEIHTTYQHHLLSPPFLIHYCSSR